LVALFGWSWFVGWLANDLPIEGDTFQLDRQSTVFVAPCDSDSVPEAFAISGFTDVVGDVGGFLARACGWCCFIGHTMFLVCWLVRPQPLRPHGSDQKSRRRSEHAPFTLKIGGISGGSDFLLEWTDCGFKQANHQVVWLVLTACKECLASGHGNSGERLASPGFGYVCDFTMATGDPERAACWLKR